MQSFFSLYEMRNSNTFWSAVKVILFDISPQAGKSSNRGLLILSQSSSAFDHFHYYILVWIQSKPCCLSAHPTTYFCARIHALPVEEGGPKLSERRKLLLGVHHQGMAWHHRAWRSLAHDDEPESKSDREDEDPETYLSVVGSGPTRISGKSWETI